jgi:multidrug efflux pump subunit AcrB
VNGQRTLTLSVTPPDDMTVQEALNTLHDDVDAQLRAIMADDMSLQYRGTADRLEHAFTTMGWNLLTAAVVLFLILAAMFRSPRDAFIVMLSMPLAIAGGVAALRVLNLITIQAMDLLTMIGFLILLGLVVNNAILLVMQTRNGLTNGLDRTAAVADAVRMRARPIYMSTLTSIFGMLPLMVVPGTGSQIYRGLATVIIGGMFVSAIFTLILMPSILRLPPIEYSRLFGRAKTPESVSGVAADA